MSIENKINIDLFKVIKSAMHTSADLESMGNNLVQLMTGALDIKGCSLFAANPQKKRTGYFHHLWLEYNISEKRCDFVQKKHCSHLQQKTGCD